jgi:hypothetical protein
MGSKIIAQTKKARLKADIPPTPGDEYGEQLTNSMLGQRPKAVKEVAARKKARIDPSRFKVGVKVTQIIKGGRFTRLSVTIIDVNRDKQMLSCQMDHEPRIIEVKFSAVTEIADPKDFK